MKRRDLLAGLAGVPLVAGLGATAAGQDAYPSRLVKILVPFGPGGSTDIISRLIGKQLETMTGKAFVIENKPGATGMIGMDAVAKAAPDGYTMGILFLTHTVLPELFGKMPYDTARDLAPVANVAWLYNVLVVPVSSSVKSLQDLIERAKARPGQLTYASGGVGSPAHLLGETFSQTAQIKMLHVPFKGPAEAVQGLLGGQVDAMFATTSVAVPMARGDKVHALAVTSPNRLAALPAVPTVAEAGVTGFEIREWEGVGGPAGVPAPIIERWNTALGQIMAQPEVKARLNELGMTPANPNTSAEFGHLIKNELGYWTKLVRTAGIRAQ